MLRRDGMAAFAERYAYGPTRVQFANKDPRGHAAFKRMLAEHSALGSANTQAGVQKERPSLYDLTDALAGLTVPTLILAGDEDWPCLTPSLMLKQVIPSAALAMLPNTGHALSVEEPDAYNRLLDAFLGQVESGRWPLRDPRAVSATITGIKG
jgi:pimeloyl-ACP methyl ester carboxylesterase